MAAENQRVGDCPSEEPEAVEEEENLDNASTFLTFPDVLAAMQSQRNAQMLTALPAPVKRRLKALKKIQFEQSSVEAKFFEEIHALECKYHQLYAPFYNKRSNIIAGVCEPNDEECDWPSEEEDELVRETEKVKIGEDKKPEEEKKEEENNVKGVPEFWLTIFRNVVLLSEMMKEYDEPILKHLIDIKTKFIESPMGFVLEFHFEPNEYFTNTVLTKEYDMKCAPDPDDPFGFEGPEIYKCRGCQISWNKGKNTTMKIVKKRQKHKSRGLVRTITKTVQNDSFFNFFNPPTIPDDLNSEDVDDELRTLLTTDFEIGHYIRERIVPRAVLYFTGEAIEDEEYDADDDEDEEEEEDDEDEDSEGGKELNPYDADDVVEEEEDDEDEDSEGGEEVPKKNDQNCKQQ